ncbi:MAG: hypothetical protein ACLFUC_02870 [Bacteroidales bacterium]
MKTTTSHVNKVFFPVFILLFASCSPEYIPNMVNAPMLSNKGEVQVSANTGSSGFDPQLAFAATDHLGFIVNGSFRNDTRDSANYHKHSMVELGAGYFDKLGTSGRYELYGGYGFGNVEGYWGSDESIFNDAANARFNRFFLQPAIGASTSFFDGSFAARFAFVNMNLQEGNVGRSAQYDAFIEPVITAKLGFKQVKFISQLGLSLPLTDDAILHYQHQPFIFNVGVQLNFGRIYTD